MLPRKKTGVNKSNRPALNLPFLADFKKVILSLLVEKTCQVRVGLVNEKFFAISLLAKDLTGFAAILKDAILAFASKSNKAFSETNSLCLSFTFCKMTALTSRQTKSST